MTFACPNYNLKSDLCQRVNKLCVAGRPGCMLDGNVDFGEDIEVRIKRAEERAEQHRTSSQLRTLRR